MTPPATAPLRTDATAQLLLLLAREKLDASQIARAKVLGEQILDWPEFVSHAASNKSIGFVHKHLRAFAPKSLTEDLIGAIQSLSRRAAAEQLALTSSLRRFHKSCVEPADAAHVYIKGPALAAHYYDQPLLRPCSDIDILVGSADFARVARRALARGDRFIIPTEPPSFATDPADLDFLIRRSDVIMSYDASGTLFELHRHLEKTTPIFPENELVRSAKSITLGDTRVTTLSTAWHFVYICYHHSRHFWSRLHWVADLHALRTHESFNLNDTLALARSIGLHATVEASLEFASLTDKPEEWSSALSVTPAGEFLDACLRGLPGDSAFEIEGWKDMFLFDFANPWQQDPRRKHLWWARSALRRLQPDCTQYIRRRRPRALEWLYYLENAGALWGNVLKRLGPK